jgi:hypothetical protein
MLHNGTRDFFYFFIFFVVVCLNEYLGMLHIGIRFFGSIQNFYRPSTNTYLTN